MTIISIPAERWIRYANCLALMQLSEQKGENVVSVPSFEYNGYLYMGYGAIHSSYGSKPESRVMAYRLLPENLYEDETYTIYHDSQAIEQGLRERGDLTGLVVKTKRERAVCTQRVFFECLLPTTKPLLIADIKAHENKSRCYGWRSFFYKGVIPTWESLNGHPVAVYSKENECRRILYWGHGNSIYELAVDCSVLLDSENGLCMDPMLAQTPVVPASQMSLF